MVLVDPSFYLQNYTAPQSRQAAQEIAARLRQVPGIDAVSIATIPPLRRSRIERVNTQEL